METNKINKIYQEDTLEALKTFPDARIDCVVTSPLDSFSGMPYNALTKYMPRPVNRKLQEQIFSLHALGVNIPKIAQKLSRHRREHISPQRVSFYLQKRRKEEQKMALLSRMNS